MAIQVLASSSRGNCYRIDDGSTPLLLECGIRFKEIQQGLNFRVSEIAGCLVSHEHQDHAKAVSDIIKTGVNCYMSKGTAEALEVTGHRVRIIKDMQQFQVGTWTILPWEAVHDAAEPLGFLLVSKHGDRVLFATDTAYIKPRFERLTAIMVECNHSRDILDANIEAEIVPEEMRHRLIRNHMSLDACKGFLKANDLSKVEAIYLLHGSDNNSDSARFKREISELTGKPTYVC
jgi:phosphoribosyl 1,2-cyclic phosphodiesterase